MGFCSHEESNSIFKFLTNKLVFFQLFDLFTYFYPWLIAVPKSKLDAEKVKQIMQCFQQTILRHAQFYLPGRGRMCTVIHSVKKLRVEPMTAKAGSRGHVRWAGRMTSCVMTHDLAMPAECTGRSSTLLLLCIVLVSWREPAAARAASRLFFFFFFWRVSGIPETYAKYAPGLKKGYFPTFPNI